MINSTPQPQRKSKMARRKSAPVNAPSTLAEATALLGEYARGLTTIESMRAHYDAIIADLQAERDRCIAPVEEGLKDLFIGLRAWWAVSGDKVTDGKRKTAEIAGCLVGLRIDNPSLKLPKDMTDEQIVEWLDEHFAEDVLTVSVKPNKPALIALLRGEDGPEKQELLAKGFETRQAEKFFIDRVKLDPAQPDPEQMPADSLQVGEAA
jgi:phage host-nuclease inhibitor protein Gam